VALPVEEICAAVFDALNTFQAGREQYDDMTILMVAVD
jgi:serine phosphatase RsbU (regulator of sigma subunit)